MKKFFFCGLMVLNLIFSCLSVNSNAYSAEYTADHIPWSGYWWPFRYGGLLTGADYLGNPAPLEKYLLLTTGKTTGDLTTWFRNRYYNPEAPSWYGLCANWAWASLMEKYEILPSSEDNIVFRVGDKKGLLTLSHDSDLAETGFGFRPEEFHFWLLNYIGTQKKSFTADLDAGDQVWVFPIYAYDMSISESGNVRSVTVKIFYASDSVKPDYIGTSSRQQTYTYDLQLDDTGAILSGVWTGESVVNHPDIMYFPIKQHANSPYLDYETVRRIAQSRDDFLEDPSGNNQPTDLEPGTYHLVLLDSDDYILSTQAGDHVKVTATRQVGDNQDIQVQVSGGRGGAVFSDALTDRYLAESVSYEFDALSGGYMVSLTQEDYNVPGIYSLSVDMSGAYNQLVPYIPKNGQWSGFIIANSDESETASVRLVTYASDGTPIQTVYGPSEILPRNNEVLLFENLSWRTHEYRDTDFIRLIASRPVHMVNLFAHDQQPMAGFSGGRNSGSHLVFPDTYDANGRPYVRGGVFNESFTDADVSFRLFSADGSLNFEFDQKIPARSRIAISPAEYPFYYFSDGGWMEIIAPDGSSLTAYQYVTDKSGKKDMAETLFAMPVENTVKIVPHITPTLGWWQTTLTLINPTDAENLVNLHPARAGVNNDEDMNLTLAPYEKQVIDLSGSFGKLPGDDLYRSILEISGEHEIVGYYTYAPPSGGDAASFRLIDDESLKSKLVLPHYAGRGGYFWTSICVCNPNPFSVRVTVLPYGAGGDALEDLATTMDLEAGAYETSRVHSLFGDDAVEVHSIEFTSDFPANAKIGGFYLYGNMDMEKKITSTEMLSGANM